MALLAAACVVLLLLETAWRAVPGVLQLRAALPTGALSAASILLLVICATSLVWLASATQAAARGQKSDRRRGRRPLHVILATLAAIYVTASLLGLNGSSSGMWRYVADQQDAAQSTLLGMPKDIRSDEWMMHTSWMFSQASHKPPFPLVNPNVGDGPMPLLMNLPVWHWSQLFRPQMWSFHIFAFERAFAFYWNFKWAALVVAGLLFFHQLTNGRTFLALAASLLLLFSPFVQWWFSTPTCMPEMVAMLFFAAVALAWIMTAKTWRAASSAAVLLVFSLTNFVFCAYPRFQIPLLWLGAFLLAGAVFHGRGGLRSPRFFGAVAALCCAAGIVWLWWCEVGQLAQAIGQLAYPGAIRVRGGGIAWHEFFAPLLELGLSEENFPAGAMNACEVAGFLFLTPLLVAAAIKDASERRADPLVLACCSFALVVIVFMVGGIPQWLANVTGWSYVYSARAALALGLASAAGLMRWLSRPPHDFAVRPGRTLRVFAVVGALLFGVLAWTNRQLEQFVTIGEVAACAVFFAAAAVLLWYRQLAPGCFLLVAPLVCTTALINPVSRGLPGIVESEVYRWVAEHHGRDASARWLVAGDSPRSRAMPHLVQAAGARCYGGIRCTPNREMLRVLDPQDRFRAVHDRFAWIAFSPAPADAEPAFDLTFVNAYTVNLPANPQLMDALQVKYLIEVDLPPDPTRFAGYEPIGELHGCRLLVRSAQP